MFKKLKKVIEHEFWLKTKTRKTYRRSLSNVIKKAKCTRKLIPCVIIAKGSTLMNEIF